MAKQIWDKLSEPDYFLEFVAARGAHNLTTSVRFIVFHKIKKKLQYFNVNLN